MTNRVPPSLNHATMALITLAASLIAAAPIVAANPTATFETSMGTFSAEIYLDRVPRTASNFIDLTASEALQRVALPPRHRRFYEPIRLPALQGDPHSPQAGTGGPSDGTFVNLGTGGTREGSNGGNIEDENISKGFERGRLALDGKYRPAE